MIDYTISFESGVLSQNFYSTAKLVYFMWSYHNSGLCHFDRSPYFCPFDRSTHDSQKPKLNKIRELSKRADHVVNHMLSLDD